MTEPINTTWLREEAAGLSGKRINVLLSSMCVRAIADEIDALRQQLTDANKRMDEIMQEYAAIKFKGVGEQHVYPVPRKRHAVREGD